MEEQVVTDATVLIEFNGREYRVRIIKNDKIIRDFDAKLRIEEGVGH